MGKNSEIWELQTSYRGGWVWRLYRLYDTDSEDKSFIDRCGHESTCVKLQDNDKGSVKRDSVPT